MESPLTHFRFAQFQFVLKALEAIHLPPYKGSTLRGGFGYAFKKVVCVTRDKICASCLLKEKCVYSYVFETPPPPDTAKMRKYPYTPHPFIITPPLEDKREWRVGEVLSFELTLVGKSIDYLPYFIYTIEELGKIGIGKGKGRFELKEVRSLEEQARGPIYTSGTKNLQHSVRETRLKDLYDSSPISVVPHACMLWFVTPTRLKFDGKLAPTLGFSTSYPEPSQKDLTTVISPLRRGDGP